VAQASKLGRLIYLLDKAAALGSDALLARIPPKDHVPIGGFLATRDVEPSGAEKPSFTVLFFTPGDGPHIAYRVRVPFKPGARSTVEDVTPPAEPNKPTEVLIRARATALAALPKTAQPINPVVLLARPTIGEEGILVYLLAGTKTRDLAVFGKHHRVLLSADGTTVLRFEPLSKSALEISLQVARPGSKPVEMIVSHIVTDYPLETHVFVSLLHNVPVIVVTQRGTWRVDGERIEFLGGRKLGSAPGPAPGASSPSLPTCPDLCASVLAARCPNGPRDRDDCITPCEKFRSGSCLERFRALIDCSGSTPHVGCDPRGFVTVTGCETPYREFLLCGSARPNAP